MQRWQSQVWGVEKLFWGGGGDHRGQGPHHGRMRQVPRVHGCTETGTVYGEPRVAQQRPSPQLEGK